LNPARLDENAIHSPSGDQVEWSVFTIVRDASSQWLASRSMRGLLSVPRFPPIVLTRSASEHFPPGDVRLKKPKLASLDFEAYFSGPPKWRNL
jgi:hypothetical protein